MRMLQRPVFLPAAAFVVSCAFRALAGDWPTFRHDIERSGATDEALSLPLERVWTFEERFRPEPAFGPGFPYVTNWEGGVEKRRIDFDRSDSVVAVGGRIYFGSVGDGKVYCLEAADGKVIWTFATGGPVRLAPAVQDGCVYVGSDDGWVYCLAASDGKVIWKFRAAPEDLRLPGSGSLVSLWPVRTGVLVDAGTAYFGAGIFAAEGVFLYAVDAKTGALRWRNDKGGEMRMAQICPMGYLLATPERLVVPMARLAPAVYSRKTGEHELRLSIYYGGGTFAALRDGLLYTGWESAFCFPIVNNAVSEQGTSRTLASFPGGQLVAAGGRVYSCNLPKTAGVSTAVKAFAWTPPAQVATAEEARRGEAAPVEAPKEIWSTDVAEPESIILAGSTLFVGRKDEVLALDSQTGKVAWSGKTEGIALSLTVAGGRLYASTDAGKIHCFAAPGTKAVGPVAEAAAGAPAAEARVQQAAEAILALAPEARKGYAVVCGTQTGELAVELARRTDMKVYALASDAARAAAARRRADAAGLGGGRVVALEWPGDRIPFTQYVADLVVSETAVLDGKPDGSAAEMARIAKPVRGRVVIGWPGKEGAAALKGWIGGTPLAPAAVEEGAKGSWAVFTQPALKGGKSWTHQYGNPGGTGSSEDELVRAPLRVQWYGGPGAERFVDRHYWGAAPLALDGRMFVCSYDDVTAYDVYNGAALWTYPLKNATRAHVADVPSNVAVSEEGFFVAVDEKCTRLDPVTGRVLATYTVPAADDGGRRMWGYVAVSDGVLVGSRTLGYVPMEQWPKSRGEQVPLWLCSDVLFAVDIASGKLLWTHKAEWFRHNNPVIGEGAVFVSHPGPATQEECDKALAETRAIVATWPERERQATAKMAAHLELLMALDLRTGQARWQRVADWTLCGGGRGALIYKDGLLLQMTDVGGCKAFAGYDPQGLAGPSITVRDAKTGDVRWVKSLNYRSRAVVVKDTIYAEPWAFELKTGAQKMVAHPLTGVKVPWQFVRPEKHCGPFNASASMLFFRNGGFGYCDVTVDEGVARFESNRPNCWNSFISADGVALWPTSDSGCRCGLAMQCTVALMHSETNRVFADYSVSGALTPVRQVTLNLGAPGDRRDGAGRLWLAWPRQAYGGGLVLPVAAEFYEGGRFDSRSAAWNSVAGTETPWVYTSGGFGLKRLTVPLRAEADGAAAYTVKLLFAAPAGDVAGQRVFDVALQGAAVQRGLDVVREAGAPEKAWVASFKGVRVKDALVVELTARSDKPGSAAWPVLCGVEAVAE